VERGKRDTGQRAALRLTLGTTYLTTARAANVIEQPLQGLELWPCWEAPAGMLGFTHLAQAALTSGWWF